MSNAVPSQALLKVYRTPLSPEERLLAESAGVIVHQGTNGFKVLAVWKAVTDGVAYYSVGMQQRHKTFLTLNEAITAFHCLSSGSH